jgi:uncharacterized protein YndB with AHSA1/START domain
MSTKDNEQEGQNIEIQKTIVIDASPEVIFKAITDPEELTQWFPDQAALEPRIGGKVRFDFSETKSGKKGGSGIQGTITEFISNEKISYTWEHTHNSSEISKSVVTWELVRIKDDGTRVNLKHTGSKTKEIAKERDQGWSYFLPQLKKYCEGTE